MQRRSFFSKMVAIVSSILIRPQTVFASATSVEPQPAEAPSESTDGFKPISSPRRFRIVRAEWAPNQLAQHYHDYFYDALRKKTQNDPQVKARAIELLKAYQVARDAYPNPDSLLAIPPHMQGECEFLEFAKKLLTREEAIETAAEWNKEFLDKFNGDDGRYVRNSWFVVFEHGKTRLSSDCVGGTEFVFDETGWGAELRNARTELRLVRPTSKELARYAVPANSVV